MNSQFPRGSEWRKWDLHIHTPLSIIQHYGGNKPEVWEKYLQALEGLPAEVKVIGINDYYFIDGFERVITEKLKNGRLKNIDKIFPLLEFRIDTFGSTGENKFKKINLHILFNLDESDIKAEVKKVREEFIGRINLTKLHTTKPLSIDNLVQCSPDKNLQTGFSELIPSTEEVFKVIESETWKSKVFLFLGYEEWHSLEKGNQLKLFKENLYKKVDAFFTASLADNTSKKEEVVKEFGNKRLLHSSDIHDFQTFENYRCSTWIKADPTFEGLRQIVVEPEERVFLGESPEQVETKKKNTALIINKVNIATKSKANEWFDGVEEIPFNPGLVAIIGNKGSGKSALADILGLSGNCHQARFSFLTKGKFLSSTTPHKKYSATIDFLDGFKNEVHFSNPISDRSKEEKVVYLSQFFVNQLCDNIEDIKELQNEIDRVIFSHLPLEERLGKNSLPDLIHEKTKHFSDVHKKEIQNLSEINRKISEGEAKLKADHRTKLKNQILELERQYKNAIETEKPVEIPVPTDGGNKTLLARTQKYSAWVHSLNSSLSAEQVRLNEFRLDVEGLKQVVEELAYFRETVSGFISGLQSRIVLTKYGVPASELVSVTYNSVNLEKAVLQANGKNESQKSRIEKISSAIAKISEQINKIKSGLSKKQKEYQGFLQAKEVWEQKCKKLLGDIQTPDSIEFLKAALKELDETIPEEIKSFRDERAKTCQRILKNIKDKEISLKQIYSYTQVEADKYSVEFGIPTGDFIQFNSSIQVSEKFDAEFFQFISQNKTGTFYRIEDGKRELGKIKESYQDLDIESYLEFPNEIVDALSHNVAIDPEKKDQKYSNDIETQLSGKSRLELYNYLFSFGYIDAKFTFTYDGKSMSLLSPGEKGILLLIFFLLIDKDRRPIVIDQPEENLDNETVFLRLVSFIRKAKKQRQIIIITHNPNLAIVCDAEQIIYCSMDKKNGNQIQYYLGSIENELSKDHALRILEGTKSAFKNRKDKYQIH